MIRAQDRDRNRERETENNPSKLGRELVSSATRVSQPASIRLEFVPFTVCYNLSIPSLPSFAPLYPCLNSPIPDQAYAPSSCHSIYQSALLQSFSSSLPILLHIAFSFVCSTLWNFSLVLSMSVFVWYISSLFLSLSLFLSILLSLVIHVNRQAASLSVRFLFIAYIVDTRGATKGNRGQWATGAYAGRLIDIEGVPHRIDCVHCSWCTYILAPVGWRTRPCHTTCSIFRDKENEIVTFRSTIGKSFYSFTNRSFWSSLGWKNRKGCIDTSRCWFRSIKELIISSSRFYASRFRYVGIVWLKNWI